MSLNSKTVGNVVEWIRGNRKLGFALVLFGCVFFVLRGIHDEHFTLHSCDFLPVYSGARCMVKEVNPYSTKALLEVNRSSGVSQERASDVMEFEAPVYPPTSLFLLAPLGAMPWKAADLLWLWMDGVVFATATLLVWDLCAEDAPVLAGFLLCAFTGTSTLLLMTANPTGPAIALCVIAVWCVLRQRLLWAGTICLAISLVLKPQMAGFVWLYFLLSTPAYRRFAWKVLAVTAAMAVPAILWVSLMPASHQWLTELYRTVRMSVGPGGSDDPGIRNPTSYSYMNLQAIFAVVWDYPRFYNLITYAIAGPMIALWMWVTARSAPTKKMAYLGLATAGLLTLLPVYHRLYDGRLLLMMFPAAMLLWARSKWRGWLAVGLIVVMTLVLLNELYTFLRLHENAIYGGPLWLKLAGRPYVFLTLAAAGAFLWMYVKAARDAREVTVESDTPMVAAGRA